MALLKILSAVATALIMTFPDILDTVIQLYNIQEINKIEDIGIFRITPPPQYSDGKQKVNAKIRDNCNKIINDLKI